MGSLSKQQLDDEPDVVERHPPSLVEGPVERLCRWLCELAIISMMVMVASEVIARSLFGVSLQSTVELGGYLLVGVSFLSLSTCLVSGAYHRVEFLDARLGERGRAVLRLIFDLLCLVFCVILLWQVIRLVLRNWESGDFAATNLATPLWIPQLTMPIGIAALCYSLIKTIWADARWLAAASRVES